MKLGIVTTTNTKGQVVIPFEMRRALGIDEEVPLHLVMQGESIIISPVKAIISDVNTGSAYLDILEKTQGTWVDEDWMTLRKKRRKIELAASKKRKNTW